MRLRIEGGSSHSSSPAQDRVPAAAGSHRLRRVQTHGRLASQEDFSVQHFEKMLSARFIKTY